MGNHYNCSGCGYYYETCQCPAAPVLIKRDALGSDMKNNQMLYIAVKPIDKYEEICINYNGVRDDQTPVWFDVK